MLKQLRPRLFKKIDHSRLVLVVKTIIHMLSNETAPNTHATSRARPPATGRAGCDDRTGQVSNTVPDIASLFFKAHC